MGDATKAGTFVETKNTVLGPGSKVPHLSYLGDATLTATISHEWNHGLGEIFTALLDRGFTIRQFVEHTVLPWQMHSWMEEFADGWFRFPEDVRDQVPLMYTLVAEKTA